MESTIKAIASEVISTLNPTSYWFLMKLYLGPRFELEGQQLGDSLAELNKMIGISSRDFKNCLDELVQKNLIRLVHNVSVIKRGCSPQKVVLLGEVKEFLVQSYDEKSLADIQKVLAFKNSNDLKLMIKEKALLLYCLLIKDSVAMSEKYIKKTFDVKIKSANEKFSQYDFKFHSVSKINFDNGSRIFRIEKKDSYEVRMESYGTTFQAIFVFLKPNKQSGEQEWKALPCHFADPSLEWKVLIHCFDGITANPTLGELASLISSYFKYYRICKMEGAEHFDCIVNEMEGEAHYHYIANKMGYFGFIRAC